VSAVEVTGVINLNKMLSLFSDDVEKAVDDTVRITAFNVQKSAVLSMREQSQGIVYQKTAGVTHMASKAGDAPNIDEGLLVGSIAVEHQKGSKVAFVGTHVDYGAILELEKNRPWLEPAKASQIGKFENTLKKVIKLQIKKARK